MKKLWIIVIVVLVLVFILNTDASALSLGVKVNPFVDLTYDPNTLGFSGFAEYTVFHLSGSGEPFDAISLRFESSIFGGAFSLVPGSISVAGWGLMPGSDPELFNLANLGSGVLPGSILTFRVSYTLLPGVSLNSASWSQGGIWQQSYVGLNTSNPTFPFGGISGGSTAIAPEPGTLILLGIGLIGAGARRRFQRKRKIK